TSPPMSPDQEPKGPNLAEHKQPSERIGISKPDENKPDNKQTEESNQRRPPWYRRPVLMGGLILIVMAAAVGGVLFWRHSRTYQSTDDAYIDVASEHVSPRVAGQVVRVRINDNEDVTAGQVLVEL